MMVKRNKKEKIKISVSFWDDEWGNWVEDFALVGRGDINKVEEKIDKIFRTFKPEELEE